MKKIILFLAILPHFIYASQKEFELKKTVEWPAIADPNETITVELAKKLSPLHPYETEMYFKLEKNTRRFFLNFEKQIWETTITGVGDPRKFNIRVDHFPVKNPLIIDRFNTIKAQIQTFAAANDSCLKSCWLLCCAKAKVRTFEINNGKITEKD